MALRLYGSEHSLIKTNFLMLAERNMYTRLGVVIGFVTADFNVLFSLSWW